MLVVMIALAIGLTRALGYLPVRPFDEELWKQYRISTDVYDGHVRLHMIDHLVWSGRLDGLTRDEVLALLGPPEDRSSYSDRDLVYPLGPSRGLFRGIDWEWLVIRFGPAGRVSEYAVVTD